MRAGHALDAGDRYYAVFESYDKEVEIESITGSGDGSHDDFFMQISGNGQYKTLTFRLGTSKIDVKEAYFQVFYNGMLYEFAAKTNGIYTQNVYYEFNLLDDIPGFSGGTVEVRFKIVSSVDNIYYSTYNKNEDYYTIEIVDNGSGFINSDIVAVGQSVSVDNNGAYYYIQDFGFYYSGNVYIDLYFDHLGTTTRIRVDAPDYNEYLYEESNVNYKDIVQVVGNTRYTFRVTITRHIVQNPDAQVSYYTYFTLNVGWPTEEEI